MDERHHSEPRRLLESEDDPQIGALLRGLPAPEPPLGAEARAWARLTAHRESRRPRLFLWAAISSLAAAAAVLLVLREGEPNQPELTGQLAALTLVEGEVLAKAGEHLARGASLPSGAELATGQGSRAYLRFETAGAMLAPSTRLALRGTSAGALRLELWEGEVLVSSSKRAPGAELTVAASGHLVTVVGTVFRVRSKPFGVQVLQGTVRVQEPRGEQHQVQPGAAFGTGGQALQSSPEELRALEEARAEHAPGAPVERSIAQEPGAAAAAPPHVQATAELAEATPPLPASRSTEPLREVSPSSPQRPVPPVVPASKRPGRGSESGRRVDESADVPSDNPRGGIALYQLGLKKLRGKDNLRGAADAFEEYRRRFPIGPLLEDAWLSLIEAHLARRTYSDALQEADGFLKRFPSSERKNQVRLLRANIHREWGDCNAAVPEYDALAAARGREADDAAFFAAVCARREGRTSEAQRRLNTYLQTFPNGRHRAEAAQAVEDRP